MTNIIHSIYYYYLIFDANQQRGISMYALDRYIPYGSGRFTGDFDGALIGGGGRERTDRRSIISS